MEYTNLLMAEYLLLHCNPLHPLFSTLLYMHEVNAFRQTGHINLLPEVAFKIFVADVHHLFAVQIFQRNDEPFGTFITKFYICKITVKN